MNPVSTVIIPICRRIPRSESELERKNGGKPRLHLVEVVCKFVISLSSSILDYVSKLENISFKILLVVEFLTEIFLFIILMFNYFDV